MKSRTGSRSFIAAVISCYLIPLIAVTSLQPGRKCVSTKARGNNHHLLFIRHSNTQIITTTSLSTPPLQSRISNIGDKRENRRKLGRRERRKRIDELQKQRRKNRWIRRYGTVEALQQTFGTGPPWGDLSPTQTRSLYHTLLPRSLLALNEMGLVNAADLAPLAYEARIAAKNYARSRCVWTGRVGVFLVDQYRSLRDKGRLMRPGTSSSMSWEEIWSKYESQILKEQMERGIELDEDELVMQTYMRILEKSCSTNQVFDDLFLRENDDDMEGDDGISLESIASRLENDVRALLLSPKEITQAEKTEKKWLKRQRKEREKEERLRMKADRKRERRKWNRL